MKEDLHLLSLVIQENPYVNGWGVVAQGMLDANIAASARACRERTALMLKHYKREDRENLKK